MDGQRPARDAWPAPLSGCWRERSPLAYRSTVDLVETRCSRTSLLSRDLDEMGARSDVISAEVDSENVSNSYSYTVHRPPSKRLIMPAKDRYHDVVVRALQKDGWTIIGEQVEVIIPERRLWLDIRATKDDRRSSILIEVKGFEKMRSPVSYLADAIGQCVVYQGALDYIGITDPLYMAVPSRAITGILGEEIGKKAVHHAHVGLLVFDPLREEVTKWMHSNTL